MKSLFWLASYPKSGNTWMRAFLANYIFNRDVPVSLNDLRVSFTDGSVEEHRRAVGGRMNPNNPLEVVRARQFLLRQIDGNGQKTNLIKTHNQNMKAFGAELIPKQLTKRAIYILRDPRDMILSYAAHYGLSIDDTIYRIGHSKNTVGDGAFVQQFLGSWSDHVLSWTRAKGFAVRTVRYEDMMADPEKTFAAAVRAVGLEVEPARLAKAIDFSSFEKLKALEEQTGFIERSEHQAAFFRSGRSGVWHEKLTPEQVAQIEADHGRVMRKYGYLD